MPNRPLRLVFAGTPAFASAHLEALLRWPGADIVAAYTQPDRPAGRGKKLSASPVKILAQEHGIPVLQPRTLRDAAAQAELAALAPDVMVVVAYGLILPAPVLAAPRLGCINVHGSILPRWRGAAPIQRAIEAGDSESGVTIMLMDEGLDTGAMLHIARCPIGPHDTAADLHDRLAELGPPALIETLTALAQGTAQPQAQDDAHSCYAAKIEKSEAAIDWTLDAAVIDRRIRAFNPFPIAYTTLHGERIKVHRAEPGPSAAAEAGTLLRADAGGLVVACGSGSVKILALQLEGGKVLDCAAVLNGRAELFCPGRRFDHA